jgi:plasmid stabilization system protein ParE
MAKINWTEEAVRWLEEIRDYVAKDDPAAAIKVVRGIYETVQLLRRFPELGYSYTLKSDRDIRVLVHGHYRIAY